MYAVVVALLLVIPLWRICQRAGLSPYLSLVAAVPFIGLLIVAAVLAFAPWPARPDAAEG
ncbi:hypothetical protein IP84_07660 [beta proteobacterium AAP99]|nr:hypothetical protein IP84_07660 [beta proteobacterium AAP99]